MTETDKNSFFSFLEGYLSEMKEHFEKVEEIKFGKKKQKIVSQIWEKLEELESLVFDLEN
jgi:hypothetical protein